jgi:hypothetical protein
MGRDLWLHLQSNRTGYGSVNASSGISRGLWNFNASSSRQHLVDHGSSRPIVSGYPPASIDLLYSVGQMMDGHRMEQYDTG